MIELLRRLLGKNGGALPKIDAQSSVSNIEKIYPHTKSFLEERYGLAITDSSARLSDILLSRGLPPAQIVYMEIQLHHRKIKARVISARDAAETLKHIPSAVLIDVRESWEMKVCALPSARVLSEDLMAEMVATWSKDTPIILYCHFGIRSQDACAYLTELGFGEAAYVKGGIDAWAKEVDPSIPQYEQAWC